MEFFRFGIALKEVFKGKKSRRRRRGRKKWKEIERERKNLRVEKRVENEMKLE